MKKADKIEEFTSYIMNQAGMESPSVNFISKVMGQVHRENEVALTPAKLISDKMWWFIGLLSTAISIYFVLNWQDHILFEYSAFFQDYLVSLDKMYSGLGGIQFSNTFVYSFLLFGVLLFFQAVLISKYSSKKLNSN